MRGRLLIRAARVAVFVSALWLPAVAQAGDGTFPDSLSSALAIGTGPKPNGVAVGDFNNDGDPDLAVTNLQAPSGVSVHLGGPDATFSAPTFLPAAAGAYWAVAVGDFNADGNQDLALADAGANNAEIRFGNGAGAFGASTLVPVGAPQVSIVIADFNADGKEDIASTAQTPKQVVVNLGDGLGGFAAAIPTTVGTRPTGLAAGDLENLGYPDLVVANQDDANIQPLYNLAHNGNFFTSTSVRSGTGAGPYAVAIGDFNGDLSQDVATADLNASAVTVALNAGTIIGGFQGPNSINGFGIFPQSIAVGDFNSDGNQDLATAASKVTVDLGAGDGTFTPPVAYGVAHNMRQVAISDFDGDGNEDLVTASDEALEIRLGAGTPPLDGNLLTNGGFEAAGAAAARMPDSPATAIPGWQASGGMSYARYGIAPNRDYPTQLQAPQWGGAEDYLWGGKGASGHDSSAVQTVDVSESAASIDAGLATARFSADLGGDTVYVDRMQGSATFLDAGGTSLGSVAIGPVNTADRKMLTILLARSATSAIPAGTRQIRVTMSADSNSDVYSSAYADNVKLTMDAPSPAPPTDTTPPPDDTTPRDTTPPDTAKGKGAKRKTTHRGAKFIFSSEPGATFECSLDGKPFASCSSPTKVKHLKRRRHVFAAEAIDVAGNVDPTPATWHWRVVRKRR